jgi:hypothetical protein
METQSLYFIEWKKCKGKVRIINLFKQFPKCYGEGTPVKCGNRILLTVRNHLHARILLLIGSKIWIRKANLTSPQFIGMPESER